MHYFLTGTPGTGKSTALRRAVALLGQDPGGFLTYYGPGRERLYLGPAWEPTVPHPERTVAVMRGGIPLPDPTAFDRLGCAALAAGPTAPFLVLDECGTLERGAAAFQRAVLAALDGPQPCLGVVKPQRTGTWLEQIAGHPQVTVIAVTPENRDTLPAWLAAALVPQLK